METLLRNAYLTACETELRACKPGNVSIHADGHGMNALDFILSSQVSAEAMCRRNASLGRRIREGAEATRHAVACNTNLGILLLGAPLIHAAWHALEGQKDDLRTALAFILSRTTIEDAADTFSAILTAKPGGLGASPKNDVHDTPKVTLTEAMASAADRDTIALQYARNYTTVFDFAIPRYHCAMSRWGDECLAAVFVYTGLFLEYGDSHVERKFGKQHDSFIAGHMKHVESALLQSSQSCEVLPVLLQADRALKEQGINPGTTADMVVASLLAVRLDSLLRAACHEKEAGLQE